MKKLLIALILTISIFLVSCDNSTTEITTTQETTTVTTLEPKYVTENNVYTLDVYLDDESRTLGVSGEICFKNDDYDLEELYITLYPNAANAGLGEYNVTIYYITINDIEYDYLETIKNMVFEDAECVVIFFFN